MLTMKDENDWEVTQDGLHIATRSFLIRRGYCCANRCRNCPYINWRQSVDWQPIPAAQVRRVRIATRTTSSVQALLNYHEQQIRHAPCYERAYHQEMISHYQMLLDHWCQHPANQYYPASET